jgi:hypothetical protein
MSADFQHLKIDRKGDAVVIILANVELYDRLMTDEVRQEMRQVLRVLKLDGTIFDIHDTLNGALLSFS